MNNEYIPFFWDPLTFDLSSFVFGLFTFFSLFSSFFFLILRGCRHFCVMTTTTTTTTTLFLAKIKKRQN